MATVTTIQSILGSPKYDREVVMGVLVTLYLTTQIFQLILPRLFSPIKLITPGRQRQIFTLWPMIILKISVSILVAEAEYSPRFRLPEDAKPFELLQHQVNIFYILVLGYIFELLYRPNPLELDVHHVFVIMGYTYYRVRFSTLPSAETVNLFQLVVIMVIYGVGPVDLASETMRFIYYGIAPKAWSAYVMKACAGTAWLGRMTQWVVMLEHLSGTAKGLLEAWGPFEMAICTAFLAYWIWMECVEIFFLVGLAKRYASKREKFSSQ